MDAALPMPGTYVIAVSGGVDSMALLHNLHTNNPGEWKLIVAHLDHGIREDSFEDRRVVQTAAAHYGLPFVYHEAHLGPGASEAAAREARYDFLRNVQRSSGARAIVTAHHQDDFLETAILNLMRGSGRKGLTALASRHDTVRPLLHVPKEALVAYAKDQGLRWREDITNVDETYLRNYIRARITPRLDTKARRQLLDHLHDLTNLNQDIDSLIFGHLHQQSIGGTIDRRWFNHLPHQVAREVLAGWLRAHGVRGFDSGTIERLVVAAKVSQPERRYPVTGGVYLRVSADLLALEVAER